MSHAVVIDLKVTDLADIEEAAKACGLEFRRDQKKFRWYGRSVGDYRAADAATNLVNANDIGKCDHALHNPGGRYEIGLVAHPEGGWRLMWDFYGEAGTGLLVDKIGMKGEKLKKAYAIATTKRVARARGMHVTELKIDGRTRLVCQKAGK